MDMTTAVDGKAKRVLAGRYVLQGLLGQGGMADVELAYDQILDRQVAAKMLRDRYATDPSFLQRFRREAQAAASLNHPNVVAVYDTGDSDGRPFIVMEYVRGRSLREVLHAEEVLPERTAEIIGEAALALHYAHERGLVHRDVKPANIMISDDGRVKVADFGIARAVNAETVTQTATVFGTAAYISPEQAQGASVDRRSDIYSLGVVLYEMLAQRPPFEGDSAVALAYKHVSEEPPPPSHSNPEVSAQLDAIVHKAMAKRPGDRYQTARELHDDLRRAMAGMSVSAPPPPAYATTRVIEPADDGTMIAPPYASGRSPYETAAPREYREERRRGARIGWIVLGLLVSALLGAATYYFLYLRPHQQIALPVVIPEVAGFDLSRAQQALIEAGFRPFVGNPVPSDAPEGTVIRTDPPAGERRPRDSQVMILPSRGPITIPVPVVSGKAPEDAEAALTRAGLTVGGRRAESSDTVREGQVISTDPPAGTQVSSKTPITLVVSSGPSRITVPDVSGRNEDEARQLVLSECPQDRPDCVTLGSQRAFNDEFPKDTVFGSDPGEGQQVPLGGKITLLVSDGPPPPPTPEPSPTQGQTPTEPPFTGDTPSHGAHSQGTNGKSPLEGLVNGLTGGN